MRLFSGGLRSSLIISAQGIRARKLRTLLSMLSLFLGVLAVVVVQAGADTARRAAMEDVELLEGRDGTIQTYLPANAEGISIVTETLKDRPDAVVSMTLRAIVGEPGVSPINFDGVNFNSESNSRPGSYQPGPGNPGGFVISCDATSVCRKIEISEQEVMPPGQAIEMQLTAMSGDVTQFRPFRPVSGQWLDFTGAPSLAPRIVINDVAAKGFNRYQIPAELAVTGAMHNMTPQIMGVVDDGLSHPAAYVRFDEMLNWLTPQAVESLGGLHLLMTPQASEIVPVLSARFVAAGLLPEGVETNRINSKERIDSQLALLRWIFLGMASLVLLIGVAGILNVGLATVGERIEEFALRRAVGTPRMLLAGIVLAETMITGLLTAGLAIGVAALAMDQADRFVGDFGPARLLQDMTFPWQAGLAGVTAGLVAGLLGGLVPAIRAARIPIATVMRA